MKKPFTLLAVLLLPAILCAQQLIHVPGDYGTIQAAIDAAAYGDTVLVAPDTYLENLQIVGNDKVITLASNFIFSGDTNDINNTIIDASQPANPNYGMGVLVKNQDAGLFTKIIGFTITGGTGFYQTYGGGIYAHFASPVIEHNHINNCHVLGLQSRGGGIHAGNMGGDTSKVVLIKDNRIENCSVTVNQLYGYGYGAGINIGTIHAVIEDNIIRNNIINGDTTTYCCGGGISVLNESQPDDSFLCRLTFKNNLVQNNEINSLQAFGGGILVNEVYTVYVKSIIEGNSFIGNSCLSSLPMMGNPFAVGGAMNLTAPAEGSVIKNNIITDNFCFGTWVNNAGGGIHVDRYDPAPADIILVIENNRITDNTAYAGAGLNLMNTIVKVENNFISGNHAPNNAGGIWFNGPFNTALVSEFVNNTITNNYTSAQGKGGSMHIAGVCDVLLMNNIFWGNEAGEWDEIRILNATVEIHNCDINQDEVLGTWSGENNFYADPCFCDDTCHIDAGSPCFDTGADSVFFTGSWYYPPDEDFEGSPRPFFGGFDIGADEFDNEGVDEPSVVSLQSSVSVYPNPTNGVSSFGFRVSSSGHVTLKIYDVRGNEVATVLDEEMAVGEHVVRYDLSALPAGVYVAELRAEGEGRRAESVGRRAVSKIIKF